MCRQDRHSYECLLPPVQSAYPLHLPSASQLQAAASAALQGAPTTHDHGTAAVPKVQAAGPSRTLHKHLQSWPRLATDQAAATCRSAWQLWLLSTRSS